MASETSPARVAFEAFRQSVASGKILDVNATILQQAFADVEWEDLPAWEREGWAAAAEAITAVVQGHPERAEPDA